MTEFRLTQISDTHLDRRLQQLTDNFHRVSEYIDATRPDLVINSGDISFDGPTSRSDLEFARELHDALPVPSRLLPGNHDLGDNPTAIGPAPKQPATEKERQNYLDVIGEDRWRFDEAGWCFIGLNSLIMNTGIESEAEQFDWLKSELSKASGKPVALLVPLPEESESSLARMIADGQVIPAQGNLAGFLRANPPLPPLPGPKSLTEILLEMREEESF